MTYTININGLIGDENDSHISVLDRGFLYGDSVYEVMRTYQGTLFAISEHLERLDASAAGLCIELPPRDALKRELHRTLEAAGHQDSYCRIIVTRGSGALTLDPTHAKDPQVIVIVKAYEPFPEWMYERGIKLAIPGLRRAAHPSIKSGNYLNSVLALGRAKQLGCDDALLVDANGCITEGTSSNIFICEERTLITPPSDAGLLAGVTRKRIVAVAHNEGYLVREEPLPPERVFAADEVMLTSTLREVMPVVGIDGHGIGAGTPGPIACRLRQAFHESALCEIRAQAEGSPSRR